MPPYLPLRPAKQCSSPEQSQLTPNWRISAPGQPWTDSNKPTTSSRRNQGRPRPCDYRASHSPWLPSVPECNPRVALCVHSVLLPQAACVTSKLLLSLSGAKGHVLGHPHHPKSRPSAQQPAGRRSFQQAPPSPEKALLGFSAQGPAPWLCSFPSCPRPVSPQLAAALPSSLPYLSMNQFLVLNVLCQNKAAKASRNYVSCPWSKPRA